MATGYYAVMDCRTALYVIGVVSMLSCCATAPTPRSGDASRAQLVDVTDKLSVRKCNWACGGIRPLSSSSCLPEGTTAVGNTEIAAASVISTVAVLCSIVARSGRMFRREYAGNIWGEGDPHVTESGGAAAKPGNASWTLPGGVPRNAIMAAPRGGETTAGGAMPACAVGHVVTLFPPLDGTQPDPGRPRPSAADEEAERRGDAMYPRGKRASIGSAGVEYDECGGTGGKPPGHVRSRSPSATSTILALLQLLLTAMLSLVKYAAMEASWLTGLITSIRSLFLTYALTPRKYRTESARTRARTSSHAAVVGFAALAVASCVRHVSAQASSAPSANNSRSCVQVVDVVDDFSLGGQSNCRSCGQLSFSFSLEGTTAVETNTVNLALVLDGSGSIDSDDWELEKEFAQNAVTAFNERNLFQNGGTASYVQFSNGVVNSGTFYSVQDFDDFVDADIQYRSGTNIASGIEEGRRLLNLNESLAAGAVMIVITDGASDRTSAEFQANAARGEGTVVFAVGVGIGVDNMTLVAIGGEADNVFDIDEFEELDEALDDILSTEVSLRCASTSAEVTVEFSTPIESVAYPGAIVSGNTVTFQVDDLEANPTEFTALLDICSIADGSKDGGGTPNAVISIAYSDDQSNTPDLSVAQRAAQLGECEVGNTGMNAASVISAVATICIFAACTGGMFRGKYPGDSRGNSALANGGGIAPGVVGPPPSYPTRGTTPGVVGPPPPYPVHGITPPPPYPGRGVGPPPPYPGIIDVIPSGGESAPRGGAIAPVGNAARPAVVIGSAGVTAPAGDAPHPPAVAGPITQHGNTAPEGIEVELGPGNGNGSSGGIAGARGHDRVAPAAEPGDMEAPRQVSSRNPSATLALLIVQQLQFLAMLSLVEYIVVEDSWLADFVISIRWVHLWLPAEAAEDDVERDCRLVDGPSNLDALVFVGNVSLVVGILVAIIIVHIAVVSAVEAFWLIKAKRAPLSIQDDSGQEDPITTCRDRSQSVWLYFPHVELSFLLFAFEGAAATSVSAIRHSKCLQIFIPAIFSLGLYALFLFCTTWRIISVRVRPETIVKFARRQGRERDVPRSIRDVWNHMKNGSLLSLFDKGAWETVMVGDDQSEKVREWDWFRIGFEPMFVDYTASGTWFVLVLLVEWGATACVGTLIDNSVVQLFLFCSIRLAVFITLAWLKPYANSVTNTVEMFAVGKDGVSLFLLALSALVWEGTEAARTINNVIGGLEIASIIGMTIPVYMDTLALVFGMIWAEAHKVAGRLCCCCCCRRQTNVAENADDSPHPCKWWFSNWLTMVRRNFVAFIRDTKEAFVKPRTS